MTNLPKLVKETVCSDFWFSEVERIADSLDYAEPSTIDRAWSYLADPIDTLQQLSFDYRHRSSQFLSVLKQWYVDQRAKWHLTNDELRIDTGRQDPWRILAHVVHSRLLEKLEALYEHQQAEINGTMAFEMIDPPELPVREAHHAREVGALLRRAMDKIGRIQHSIHPAPYEFEIYRSILDSAAMHFETMADRSANYREAA